MGIPNARQSLVKLIVSKLVQVRFTFTEEAEPIAKLLNRYDNVPMSFADACLVRTCEQLSGATLFTTYSDFTIYRKHGRQVIPVIMPNVTR